MWWFYNYVLRLTFDVVFVSWWNHCKSRTFTYPIEPWWRHQMETFSRYWPFVRGIHRSPVNSPHKGQWRGALMFSLICAGIDGWVNTREAGDLRRHRAHYDVIVMQGKVTLHWLNYHWSSTQFKQIFPFHYDDVIMTTLASQITSLTVVYSIVYSGVDERKHQSSASLAFVRGIHRDRWIPRTKGQ